MDLERLIESGAKVIDVRTRAEYMGGNVPGSKNIPLNEIIDRIEEFKSAGVPLILCCASGGRSGQAHNYLSSFGIECYNGGSWFDVNFAVANSAS